MTIVGKGGHAATPHQCVDPITLAARVVTTLQEIVSRTLDPVRPGVLSIGKIYSDGGATNVIPDKVYLEGTLRAMDETWRFETHDRIIRWVQELCRSAGGDAIVRIEKGYPCLLNNEKVTAACRDLAIHFLGEENVHELPIRMTAEDFAFYAQEVDATFYRLGTAGPENEKSAPVHTNRFDIHEPALKTGMGLMAFLALTYQG